MVRLTSLPTELLETILKLAITRNAPYLGGVCKAFLPIARAITFRSISIPNRRSFDGFEKRAWDNEAAAACIREISINVKVGPHRDEPPSSSSLRRLRLVNVDYVTFEGPEHLARALLAPTAAGMPLPAVQHMKISLDDDGCCFEPRSFRSLHYYPRLDALEIHVSGKNRRGSEVPYKRYKGQLPCDRSWWLSFTGVLLDVPAFSDLLKSFPLVDTLRLTHTRATTTSFSTLFSSVSRPTELTALSLSRTGGPVDDVLSSLRLFPNLFSLELGPNTFLSSSLPTLSALPNLSRLVFLCGANVSVADIKPLLDLPFLRTLRLDLVYKPNESFFPCNPLDYPGWTASFTFQGVGEFIDLAEKKDVKLIGLAVGLVKRERDYEAKWGKKHA